MALTSRQEGFAQSVASGLSLADAYRANYRCTNRGNGALWVDASKLAASPNVHLRIEALKAAVTEKAIERLAITKEIIMCRLLSNAERMGNDVPVQVTDEDGNTRIERIPPSPAHIQASNRALELLGKELGMFVERKEIRTGSLDDLTERELREYIAELDRALEQAGS